MAPSRQNICVQEYDDDDVMMENGIRDTQDEDGSETEDEVTFLLRLRPTPSPPARRRRHSVDCRPVSQNKDTGLFYYLYIKIYNQIIRVN